MLVLGGKWRRKRGEVLLWPNLEGSDEAPTTAKYFAVMKVRAAASVDMSSLSHIYLCLC
jgi:hypothetical protein